MRKLVLTAVLVIAAATARADFDAGLKAYRAKDYATALTEFRALADRGVVLAYTNLGYMYALGEGVKADMAAAADWFRKAAEAGSAAAQLTLGVLYFNGEGVARDLPRAYAWLNVAATAGRGDALDYMSIVMNRMTGEQNAAAQKLSRDLYERYGDHGRAGLTEPPRGANAGGSRSERGRDR